MKMKAKERDAVSRAIIATLIFGGAQLGAASAQERGDSYVSLSGGAALLTDSDNSGAFVGPFTTGEGTTIPSGVVLPDGTAVGWTTEFDTGYAISAAYGRRFGGVRGEIEAVWQKNGIASHSDVIAGGIPLATEDAGVLITGSSNIGATVADIVADGQGDVRTIFLMANALYDFENDSPFTPYIGGGVGVGFVNVDYSPSGVGIIDDNATAFAWQAMAGVSWALTNNAEIFAGYRYRATSDLTAQADLFSADLEIENRASVIEGGLRWSF